MQFMLFIEVDEAGIKDPAGTGPISPEFVAYTEAMKKAGVWVTGDRLKASRYGARVSIREGKTIVLDGPYADAKEQVAGYFVIDAPTMEEALEWAARCPAARFGTVDVRPFADVPR